MKLKALLEKKSNASCSNLSFDERTANSSYSSHSLSSLSYYFSVKKPQDQHRPQSSAEAHTTTKIEKSVSFEERFKTRRIPYPSKTQSNASWYDDGDYKEFKKDCVQTAGLADRLGKRYVEASGKFTCWGLEALTIVEDEVDEKNRRRNQALNLVLDEQERQSKVGSKNRSSPSKIRAVVKPVSSKSAKEARARGRQYARDETLKSYWTGIENDDSSTNIIARNEEKVIIFRGPEDKRINVLSRQSFIAKESQCFRRTSATTSSSRNADKAAKRHRRKQIVDSVLDEQERQWKQVGKEGDSPCKTIPSSKSGARETRARGRQYARATTTLKSYKLNKQVVIENDDDPSSIIARKEEEEIFIGRPGDDKINLLRHSFPKKTPRSFRRRIAAAAPPPAKQQVVAGMA